jgi:hypothetical protein
MKADKRAERPKIVGYKAQLKIAISQMSNEGLITPRNRPSLQRHKEIKVKNKNLEDLRIAEELKMKNMVIQQELFVNFSKNFVNSSDKNIISELNKLNQNNDKWIKLTKNDVIATGRLESGKAIFIGLGKVNTDTQKSTGIYHILEHADEFTAIGIPTSELPRLLIDTLKNGKTTGQFVGRGVTRPIYKAIYNGKEFEVGITLSDAGFIVGANITTTKKGSLNLQ